MAELSLWLDNYDDIYSDFDSRHYLKRRVSEDFLYELKNALRYKEERITDLLLMLPKEKRNETNEKIIVESLKKFFSFQLIAYTDKCIHKFNSGIGFAITGILIMVLNSFIGFKDSHFLLLVTLRIILEPAGWFLLWAAFDFLFYDWKEMRKERKFFQELSEMNIHFRSS